MVRVFVQYMFQVMTFFKVAFVVVNKLAVIIEAHNY
jgi:hypothetical protein